MKVLVVHNFYQSSSPSGEDAVFRNEVELLKKNGINVITYEKHNDEIQEYGLGKKLLLPLNNIWSGKTYRELNQILRKEKPALVHFHNIWYLISPSAYDACKDAGVPVVQTLHNFRISCVNGLLLRDGHVCEECITKKTGYRSEVMGDRFKLIKNAIKYSCYRNSRLYSLPIALMAYFHWMKKTWIDKVDAYINLTEFGRKKFIEAGLPVNKLFVKPNFLADPPEPKYTHKNYAIFLGRISVEKGIDVLINAFKYLFPRNHELSPMTHDLFHLKIVGDGPLRKTLQETIANEKIKNIEFTGRKNFKEAMELLRNAQFMIMPSLWYETFGMTAVEAFACGKPVIASNLGAMAELVEDGKTGLLFEPGNPADLAEKMKWMIGHEAECIEMGRNARKVFEEKYTAERNFEILMDIYQKIIGKQNTTK